MLIVTKLLQQLEIGVWHDVDSIILSMDGLSASKRQLLRTIAGEVPDVVTSLDAVRDGNNKPLNSALLPHLKTWITSKRYRVFIFQILSDNLLVLSDLRGHLRFFRAERLDSLTAASALNQMSEEVKIVPHLEAQAFLAEAQLNGNLEVLDVAHSPLSFKPQIVRQVKKQDHKHLKELEGESIHIMREAVAAAERPAMLFSLGKDSMAMLRLAQKAFAPEPLPFPLVNIDTRWKFQDMNAFREWMKSSAEFRFIHFVNPEAIEQNVSPFTHGSAKHTHITKTLALKKVLDEYKFDFVFGGARRDEEKSRAKERIFSIRDSSHGWDPRNQRPELWNNYNTYLVNNQSMRVFPLSNWTEVDIWRYLEAEQVPVVPLYFAKRRPFVDRQGSLIMVDDDRFEFEPGEKVRFEQLRFRSLGCYPLSGGILSKAKDFDNIIAELESTKVSERNSRVIDFDRGASMEQKKREGYF